MAHRHRCALFVTVSGLTKMEIERVDLQKLITNVLLFYMNDIGNDEPLQVLMMERVRY